MSTAVIRRAFLAAPLFLLIGVIGMKFGWKGNNDLDWGVALPLWTGAHVMYILGYLFFGIVLNELWTRARASARNGVERGSVDVLAVAGAVGLIAMLGQMVIDLLVGFQADSRADMSGISRSFHDIPGFDTFFYGAVPALQLTATAILILMLAFRRQVSAWPAVAFLGGSLCIATGVTALMVTGGVALCVALPAMARRTTSGTTSSRDRVAQPS
jgi:hypothetical protein